MSEENNEGRLAYFAARHRQALVENFNYCLGAHKREREIDKKSSRRCKKRDRESLFGREEFENKNGVDGSYWSAGLSLKNTRRRKFWRLPARGSHRSKKTPARWLMIARVYQLREHSTSKKYTHQQQWRRQRWLLYMYSRVCMYLWKEIHTPCAGKRRKERRQIPPPPPPFLFSAFSNTAPFVFDYQSCSAPARR